MREFGDRYYREQTMRKRKNPSEFLRPGRSPVFLEQKPGVSDI
jgi:hypothetical protein